MVDIEIDESLTNEELKAYFESYASLKTLKEKIALGWGLLKDLTGNGEFRKRFDLIKNGKVLKFDLRLVTEGQVDEYLDEKQVIIHGCDKVNIKDYWDELELRDKEIRNILRMCWDEGDQTEARIGGYEEYE